MNPILVTVNRPESQFSTFAPPTLQHSIRTGLHLLTQLYPEALGIRVMEVDEFSKEEDDSGSPEYYDMH